MSAARIIARANKMFTRAASISAKAQALLESISEDGTPVAKVARVPREKKVRVTRAERLAAIEAAKKPAPKKVLKGTPVKKARRVAVVEEEEEVPVRKARVAKKEVPVAKKAPAAKKAKAVDLEVVNKKAPKNVKIQVEDDFPDL